MSTSKRSSVNLLPQIFQTETNKKFLGSTLDQLIEPSALEKLSAFIGRRHQPTYRSNSVYLEEISDERQNYQLEPTVTYSSDSQKVDFVAPYIDVVNEIHAQGGFKNDHNRLWQSESYAYSPPIDSDKFVNYRQYYWLKNGPTPITSILGTPGSEITIKVENKNISAWRFNNKGTNNPDIVLYKGNTYKFVIDAPGFNFWIKTQYGTGTDDQFSQDYVTNNGTDNGTITLKVPSSDSSTTNPTVLFYQCEHHQQMQGRFIIKDLANEKFDINENLSGVNQFKDSTGLEYTSGMKIQLLNDVTSEYANKKIYIENVGKEISIIDENELLIYEDFGVSTGEVWDEDGTVGFDTVGWDNSEGVSVNQDYWTINRSSSDRNSWSRSNRWFHIDVINKTNERNPLSQVSISENLRAKRPIIEFKPNLKLFNHGSKFEKVDLVDTITTDALSQVQGTIGYRVDQTNLKVGDRVVFINDPDVKNKIFTVHFDDLPDGSEVIHLVDDSSVIQDDTNLVAINGENQKGIVYLYKDSNWVTAQQKASIQQKPIFDIVDQNGISLSDTSVYNSSNFQGNVLFEIATNSSQGTPDTVYGTNVIYKRFGLLTDLQVNDKFNSETFSYIDSAGNLKTDNIRKYYIREKIGDDFFLLNNWIKTENKTYQYKIENFTSAESQQTFEIQAWQDPHTLNDLDVQVFINGVQTKDYSLINTNFGKFVKLDTAQTQNNLISIKSYSSTGQSTSKGFWEVPTSSVSNPYNKNFTQFTFGDVIRHYNTGVENHPDAQGPAQGDNNSRNISDVFAYATQINQHSSSLPLASVITRDEVLNLTKSIRFSAREYEKIKNSIITVSNRLSLDGTVNENLDAVLTEINKNKNSNFPFHATDMLAYGSNKKTLTYTVNDPNIVNYPITELHSLDTLSNKAVYVYINDVQLIHSVDYVFTNLEDSSATVGIQINTTLNNNDVIKIHEYENTNNTFIPSTPAKLGLSPKYEPKKFLDTTYQSGGYNVIQGHDGSIMVAFNDFRDDLLLEFEKRIYNNIKTYYNPDHCDITEKYSTTEINSMITRDFYTWSGSNAVDYSGNDTYDGANEFTYNYSEDVSSVDGKKLPGFWRGIYIKLFGTDRPHTHPWEMFGFSEKPAWWENRYGPAPYTSGNLILWNDVEQGFIPEGDRKGYYPKYVRSYIHSVIPVSTSGQLLSPIACGIATGQSTSSQYAGRWNFGDHGPAETAWRRSSSYCFAEQIVKFLAYPGKYAGLYFDTSRISRAANEQFVYNGLYRQPITEYTVPGTASFTSGYINFIYDYVISLGLNIDYISNRLDNMESKLAYKLGGFSNKKNLRAIISSYNPESTNRSVYLPDENLDFLLYKSAPVDFVNYSGVIVEKTTNGYKISGYNNFDRSFKYYKPRKNHNSSDIVIGGVTDSYQDWKSGSFYAKGSIVKYENVYYRANNDTVSGTNFNQDNWSTIGRVLPLKGGIRIKKYKDYLSTTSTLAYGETLSDIQEVSEFLYGYDQWLRSKGFVFDKFSEELNLPIDWDLSVKEFLFWTGQNWEDSAVITLSPASAQLKYVKANTVGDDIISGSQFYTLLQQDGFPIQKTDLSISRLNGEFVIETDPVQDGIYNADIRAVQKEHVIVFDNLTSFKDVIYDDVLGVRQDRIKLVGWRTAEWNGDIYAPGYIVDKADIIDWLPNTDYKKGDVVSHQNKTYVSLMSHNSGELFDASRYQLKDQQPVKDLVPNFDTKAENFRDFYSLDTDNFDTEQQRYAQHLIGFETRQYFENLGLDELSQYKFYQGMIRDKGTKKPITNFKSPTQSLGTVNYDFFEEHAFRIGEYGGHRTLQSYQWQLDDLKHRQQKQVYNLTQAPVADTQNIINVSYSDFAERPTEVQYPIFSNYNYDTRYTPEYIFKYPMAGYVQSRNVDVTVWDKAELFELDIANLIESSTIWLANTETRDWDVYRVSSINNSISYYQSRDGLMKFTCESPHRLSANDLILVKGFDNDIDGVYEVAESPDSTDDQYTFSVAFNKSFDSTIQTGSIFKLQSIRIDSIDNIDSIRPDSGFKNGDKIYVDNGYQQNNGLWKIYELNDDSFFETKQNYYGTETSSNNLNYGQSIAINDGSGKTMIVGSPGDNFAYIYTRNTTSDFFAVRRALLQDYRNSDDSDQFGHCVKSSSDGSKIFVSSPYSNNILKFTLSTTSLSYTRGKIVTGSDSGATARVLLNDPDNDVMWVKVISGTFTTEALDIGDSSSLVTITSIEGTDMANQGLVHYVIKDQFGSYVIDQSFGSPTVQNDEYFGWDMAVSSDGTTLVVGAPGKTDNENDSGSSTGKVYVYTLGSSGRYSFLQTLQAPNGQVFDKFGFSVTLSSDGKTLAVGSPDHGRTDTNDSSTNNSGLVFVYRQNNDKTFTANEIINHGVNEYNTQFGYKLQLSQASGDLIISSPNETVDKPNQGVLYYYKKSSTHFTADGSTTAFECDFDIDSSHTVGATVDGDVNTSFTVLGNTVTFAVAPDNLADITISQYKKFQQITQHQPISNSKFGTNFKLRNNRLLVYAPNDDTKTVSTFDKFAEDGSTALANLTTFDGNTTTFKDTVIGTGSVYAFNRIENKYIFENKISDNSLTYNDNFGHGLDTWVDQLFVGSPGRDVYNTATSSILVNAGTVFNLQKGSTESSSWQTLSSQPNLVNPFRIKKSFVYDSISNQLTDRLDVIDPAKGKLFGNVEQNISYKTLYDPADYDSWDDQHNGEVWFDISKIKFEWYEQGDLNYRLINWGKIHPGSDVSFKEWTQSDLSPQEYNEIAGTNEGVSQNITGTAETTRFVVKQVFDNNKQKFVTRYFYWVKNPTVLPSSNYRTVTCSQMAQSIVDPTNFTNKYSAVIRQDAVLLSYTSSEIGTTTNYKIEQTTDDEQLVTHNEYAMASENDINSDLPSKILNKMIDSLIGADVNGRSVPDLTVPYQMRYGVLDRPRQSVFKDRQEALKTVIQSINQSLASKPFSSIKNLNYWNLIDPVPNQSTSGYTTAVDTDTDLSYINTESYTTGDTVLVRSDSRAEGRWTINTFNASRQFDLSIVQSYDTTTYWSYTDWYDTGYDENLIIDHTVENEITMRTTEYATGEIIKVKLSYDGKFRIYLKTYNNFQAIGIQDGTFELSSAIYDFESNSIGYGGDTYGSNVYDKQATVELRNILLGLQNDIFIDSDKVLFNNLFFLMVKIASQQDKYNDWHFKTSFIKLVSTYANLEQSPEFRFNTTDSVEDFLQEILPFKTKIRENITQYQNLDTFEGDVTDFDNPTYYDATDRIYVNPTVYPDDSSHFEVYNNYPHKFYSENYKFVVDSIDIGTAGEGYTVVPEIIISGGGGSGATAQAFISNGSISRVEVTNGGSGYISTPTVTVNGGGGTVTTTAVLSARLKNNKVRSFDGVIKFDRVNSNAGITNSTIVDWTAFTKFDQNQNIRYQNKIYQVMESFTSGNSFNDDILLGDSSSVTVDSVNVLREWTATDRIYAYYSPTVGMAGLIGDGSTNINAYAQLMTGLEYPGTRLLSLKFEEGEGYDVENYDMARYDTTQQDIVDPEQLLNLDQIVDSKTFTTDLGTRPEDIDMVGDAFLSEYSAHAPEEVLPGGVYDTLDMKVYTQATTGSGVISSKKYQGDGITTTFGVLGKIVTADSIRVFKNNIYQQPDSTDYDVDLINNTVNFVTAPAQGDIILIQTFDLSVDSLIAQYDFTGDGSTDSYIIPLSKDLAQQVYVSVNGVKTSTTVTSVDDSASTQIALSTVPPVNSKVFVYVFNKPNATKAYSEMITTEYTVSTENPSFTLTTRPGVAGPYHHKIFVEGVSGGDSTNRFRLTPPQIAYYSGDNSTVDFAVPDQPQSKYLAGSDNTEVWKNGIILTHGTDYTVSNDSTTSSVVTLTTAPSQGDSVAVVLKVGHDYEVSNDARVITLTNNWSTLTGSDSSSINNEKIFVTTFTNNDQMTMRTEVFEIDQQSNVGDTKISLSATPLNANYVFVSFNKQYISSNQDWRLEDNTLIIPEQIAVNGQSNILTVSYVSGVVSKPAIGYRVFKDILNRYHYRRLSRSHTTTLTKNLNFTDTSIEVLDASVLPQPSVETNQPGVIFIGKERITYFVKSGNTLSQIMRGTLGTSVANTHLSGTKVVDASMNQSIPYQDTLQIAEFRGDGSTTVFNMSTADDSTLITATSKSQLVVQVAGTRTYDFTVDGSNNITFATAPQDSVIVRITKKLGTVWYDQGSSTASNGLGLQASTGVEVKFLQDSPAELPDN